MKNLVLELRDDFEKEIENRLNNIGIYPDKEWKDGRSLPYLEKKELDNRRRVAVFIKREEKIGIDQKKATKEFIKEASYTWINRLLGLKCMECRGLIEEMITTRSEYGDRSRYHRNFREKNPDLAAKPDDGLIPCLFSSFKEVTEEIKVLFDPGNEYSLVVPRYPFLKKAIQKINDNLDYDTYREDEFLGWVYQYFNSREKDRVFEEVRTKKKKIAGSDIINVTQLYTEKYMVRFLVENSLGAMWMEMYPDSHLCRKWEYFVKDPNNSTRELKPVKEITFLDPACGSGHFLLYAFDLYYDMYLEEGIIPEDQIPEFILRHNLHGIDIDLRAIQLSALGLFIKAKSMQPDMTVQHMNLVSADAIMLDSEILEEFLEEFRDDPTAQELIKTIWQGLENVRELGSLLKVDEQIDEVIKHQKDKRLDFFGEGNGKGWEHWKRDLLAKLKGYYEKAAQTFDINKQMFASEACKGVQLLDLLEQRYDVVATNPPYMHKRNMEYNYRSLLQNIYPISREDIYGMFIYRNFILGTNTGYISMITQHSFMFTSRYTELRQILLENVTIRTMAHLGPYAFEDIQGEKVNTTMFTFLKNNKSKQNSIFFDLTNSFNKRKDLIDYINSNRIYIVNQKDFYYIDGSPFVYWIPKNILQIFKSNKSFSLFGKPKAGSTTSNNDKFLRYWWEINNFVNWRKYEKGDATKYYSGIENFVFWENNGEKLRNTRGSVIASEQYFDLDGIVFNLISTSEFTSRIFSKGAMFDHGANTIFELEYDLYYNLGFLNSKLIGYLLSFINPTFNFQSGDVARIPFEPPSIDIERRISALAQQCVNIKKDALQFVINDCEFKQTAIHWGLKNEL
ncbi:MAG: BREX-1 system adenine-specific DNA-methyltransferase PglX [Methanosarcinales archaeon]|nr:BREX-1 system adenine-specific DNA-methyltransferase PglX [Methanosarcinales archaeon]